MCIITKADVSVLNLKNIMIISVLTGHDYSVYDQKHVVDVEFQFFKFESRYHRRHHPGGVVRLQRFAIISGHVFMYEL